MTVAFKTFGCRLNQAETALFEAGFAAAGFTRVPFGSPARVIVVHSCAVTQAAENEGLKALRALRTRHPEACLVLCGCTVEALGAARLSGLDADLAVPRERKDDLVALVMRHLRLDYAPGPVSPDRSTQRAALKVQDGCDFFCAYCIVPHTRGAPRSRPVEACLDDARALLGVGFREIVVTGCNIASYADRGRTLVDLVRALAALPGLGRLRLGSLEPGTVERDVVALMAHTPTVCRFLHLPIQSGDDGVLTSMGRRYTSDHVRETLDEALRLMPDLGLGADFICGFPGETPEAFERTRRLVDAFPFSNLHVFPYSERPGTPAAGFAGRVPMTERKRRARVLIDLASASRVAFARRFVGHPVEFLIERYDKEGRACGWSAEYLACAVSRAPHGLRRSLLTFTPTHLTGGLLCGNA
jgi:threonylcarbamoyladenosine tRNA methylthiotransferase MtaB